MPSDFSLTSSEDSVEELPENPDDILDTPEESDVEREEITIRSNERVSVVGKTGSGKTEATKKLVWEPFDNVIFLDWKWHHYAELNAPVVRSIEDVEEALFPAREDEEVTKFVFAPQRKDLEMWDRLCYLAWKKTNVHIIADELKGLYQQDGNTKPITDWHESIMTRGRVRGVGMTGTTQRPKKIPMEALSESEHFFIFKLNLHDDRKRMAEIVGKEYVDKIRNLQNYEFLYYNTSMDDPIMCEPLKI